MRIVFALLAVGLPILEARLLLGPGGSSVAPPVRVTLAAARVRVPFLEDVDRPIVPVRVDGFGPLPFLLDTGAAGHGRIDPRWARRLGLEVVGHAVLADGTGRRSRRPVVRAGRLDLAGARFDGARLAAMDLGRLGVAGIIGFGLFDDLTATLDGPGRAVELTRSGVAAGAGALVVRGGVPWVELAVGGRSAPALVDSGASVGVLLPPRWRRDVASRSIETATLRTTHARLVAERVRLDEPVRLGGVRLPSDRASWVERFDRPLVGWHALRRLRVTFPRARKTLRIEAP